MKDAGHYFQKNLILLQPPLNLIKFQKGVLVPETPLGLPLYGTTVLYTFLIFTGTFM